MAWRKRRGSTNSENKTSLNEFPKAKGKVEKEKPTKGSRGSNQQRRKKTSSGGSIKAKGESAVRGVVTVWNATQRSGSG